MWRDCVCVSTHAFHACVCNWFGELLHDCRLSIGVHWGCSILSMIGCSPRTLRVTPDLKLILGISYIHVQTTLTATPWRGSDHTVGEWPSQADTGDWPSCYSSYKVRREKINFAVSEQCPNMTDIFRNVWYSYNRMSLHIISH